MAEPSPSLSLVQKVGLALAAVFVLGMTYLAGLTQGYYGKLTANNFATVFNDRVRNAGSPDVDFELYWTVLDLVKEKFFGEVDPQALVYGSIRGMVAALGDEYTVFSDPTENRAFFESLDGVYHGVGIEVDVIEGALTVISPLKDSPAEKAGLLPQDKILAVDGGSIEGLTLDQVLEKIKGPAGSRVRLTIGRGDILPFEVELTRQTIRRESVELEIDENGIAVIQIDRFANDTDGLVDGAINQILTRDVKGVVLDLRNNPGGFLESGVKVANEFIKSGGIVEERFKDGSVTPFVTDGRGRLLDLPLVVLINGGSASASEIVAGAIQDAGRGKILGERSFGKGSVQEVESLSDGSALRVTIAEWHTPKGRSISEAGIQPDVEVVLPQGAATDVQLEAAKDLLSKGG